MTRSAGGKEGNSTGYQPGPLKGRGGAVCVCVYVCVCECVYRWGCGSKGPSWVNSVGCEWVARRFINVLRREIFTSSRTLSFEISFLKKANKKITPRQL